jgi:hypothetical protein
MKPPCQGSRREYEEWLARVKEKGIPFRVTFNKRDGTWKIHYEVSTEALVTFEQTSMSLVGSFKYGDDFFAQCSADPSLKCFRQCDIQARIREALQMTCCELLKMFVKNGWDTRELPPFPRAVIEHGFIDTTEPPLQTVVN